MTPLVWRLVERTVGRHLPRRHRAPTLGDLLEEYEDQRRARSRLHAEIWLLRECLSLATTYRLREHIARAPSRSVMDLLRSDLVHGWRAIRARPAATLATAAVLMVGIGLVSAMFALTDPYLFRPLPYARPEDLATLAIRTRSPKDVPTLEEWNARQDLFAGVAAASTAQRVDTKILDRAAALRLSSVSDNFFNLLGVPVGLPADWRPMVAPAETPVVLTAETSTRLFGGARSVGQVIARASGEGGGFRVAAVLPAGFQDPFPRIGSRVDGFVPLERGPLVKVEGRGGGYASSAPQVLARLRPGVTPATAQAALSTVPLALRGSAPAEGIVVTANLLGPALTKQVRPLALGAFAAGLLILVVCAANVANLLLARGASRLREFAAREALGASKGDVARLVLIELALLTAFSVTGGLALTKLVLVAAALVIPPQYVTLGAPALTLRVVATAGTAGALVMLAGLVPAWAAWRIRAAALFGEMATTETRRIRMLRFVMTTAQTALAVVLVVGAALFGRSYFNLITLDPGYDGDTFAVSVSYTGNSVALSDAVDATLDRLRRIPGVTHAAAASGTLVNQSIQAVGIAKPLTIDGRPVAGTARQITEDFFEATGTRLVTGRFPAAAAANREIVVSQSFARGCCDVASPLGLVLATGDRSFAIVGVVKDIYTRALDEPPGRTAFLPMATTGGPTAGLVNYLIRSTTSDAGLALAVERDVKKIAPTATIADGNTMRARLMTTVNDRSFATLIVTCFALAALGVSAAGVIGIVGFTVAKRTREIAVRMAIGASAGDVRRLVTREAAAAAAVGGTIGFAAAIWLSKTVESLLFGITPVDPLSLAMAALLMVVVVTGAAWIPARRATRLSPTIALRTD